AVMRPRLRAGSWIGRARSTEYGDSSHRRRQTMCRRSAFTKSSASAERVRSWTARSSSSSRPSSFLRDLVHVLGMRCCAFGLVARCGNRSATRRGDAILLLLFTLILKSLCLVLVHVPPLLHRRGGTPCNPPVD